MFFKYILDYVVISYAEAITSELNYGVDTMQAAVAIGDMNSIQ